MPYEKETLIEKIKKEIYIKEKWSCMFPNCKHHAINSHILQRHGILDNIAENGHFYQLYPLSAFDVKRTGKYVDFKKIGLNNGFSWPLFCKEHDSKLFEDIERKSNIDICDYKVQLLFTYRTLCSELRKLQMQLCFYKKYSEEVPDFIKNFKSILPSKIQTISDYSFYESELLEELKDVKNRFTFYYYEIPKFGLCASAAFNYVKQNIQKEFSLLPWECCFLQIIPLKDKTIVLIGYHNTRKNDALVRYCKLWGTSDKHQLEKLLSDFCTLWAENWCISPSLFTKIEQKREEFLKLYFIYGHSYDYTKNNIDFNLFDGLLR